MEGFSWNRRARIGRTKNSAEMDRAPARGTPDAFSGATVLDLGGAV